MRNLNPPINKTYHKPTVTKIQSPPDGTQWRCPGCNVDLFGIFKKGQLEIRYRGRVLHAHGRVLVTCRSCNLQSTINTTHQIVLVVGGDIPLAVSSVNATEEAVKLAEKLGVDLTTVNGSGKDGRILIRDVKATE